MPSVAAAQRFSVRVGEREHVVDVDADNRVIVDGVAYTVVAGAEGRVAVRTADGTDHTLVTVGPTVAPTQAAMDGVVYGIEVLTAQQAMLAAIGGGTRSGGDGRSVVSPMPGRVVRVLVSEGETVAADAAVIIVEAMKMENEVRVAKAAKVVRIAVAAGDTVDSAQLLIELEPIADA